MPRAATSRIHATADSVGNSIGDCVCDCVGDSVANPLGTALVTTITLALTVTVALALSLGIVSPRAPGAEATPADPLAPDAPPRSAWLPADAVISIEVSRPEAALDPLLDPRLASIVRELPGYPRWSTEPGYLGLTAGVALVETQLGTDWRTAARKLLGGGISLALRADGSAIVVSDSTDEALLGKLHEVSVSLTRMDAARRGEGDRVATLEHRGVTFWSLGPEEFHAILGNRIIIANREEALRRALDLRAEGEGPGSQGGDAGGGLDSNAAVGDGRKALGGRPFATAHVDLSALKLHPGLQQALQGGKEPFPALLFAGLADALRTSRWLALGLERIADGIRLEAVVDGKISGGGVAASFAVPPAVRPPAEDGGAPSDGLPAGALPNLDVPGRIAALSLWRDLHAFYAAKDRLFPDRTAGLIFFENMMGIFFSGLDLTEEVFGQMAPEIRAVVATQRYDPKAGEPQVRLPGFAILLRLEDPERFGEVMEEAWQKALGLVNFTRGQKAEPGMLIDREVHGGVKYSYAYFRLPEGASKDLDVRYNFRPAIARSGDTLILSSTDGLARDLIDAIEGEKAKPGAKANAADCSHSILEIDGGGLREILAANREAMVASNMVDKGNSREQAEAEVGVLLDLLRYVEFLGIDAGTRDETPRAVLELRLGSAGSAGPAEGGSIRVRREGRPDASLPQAHPHAWALAPPEAPPDARPILAESSAEASRDR